MMRPKVVFPMYLRLEDGHVIEEARQLDAAGKPLPRMQSRSGFMREAVLAEARRRLALAERLTPAKKRAKAS